MLASRSSFTSTFLLMLFQMLRHYSFSSLFAPTLKNCSTLLIKFSKCIFFLKRFIYNCFRFIFTLSVGLHLICPRRPPDTITRRLYCFKVFVDWGELRLGIVYYPCRSRGSPQSPLPPSSGHIEESGSL